MIRQRLYNPAQLTSEELKASFVVREDSLAEMLRILGEQAPGRPCQHMLLIGPRGMGKTTLGLRFLHAATETPELAADWQPVPFHEESYGIGDLADFWIAALRHLSQATGLQAWEDRADALGKDERDGERLAAYAFAALMDYCRASGKRLLLFVENLDGVLAQIRDEREIHALRETLITRPEILLLGSANAVFDAIRSHGQPLYEFFRLIILQGLGPEETGRLLAGFADRDGGSDIRKSLDFERGRLETLRRLSGGNPRLMALACRMLIESPLGPPFEDLEQLIDEQTPYFKARIEELPGQARRVFHCLADGWHPMLAKEVAEAAKLTSSHASAQIRQLVEKGYAKEIRLPGEKRMRYEVADRFYNIYYLLRFSRSHRHRLERLVAFLHDLFGKFGMRRMYTPALEAVRARASRAGGSSELLEVIAGHVAADRDYPGCDDWRREALDLATELIGPKTPVRGRIQQAFKGQCPAIPQSIGEWMQRGGELFRAEQFDKAEEAYRQAVEAEPGNLHAWCSLGVALNQLERFETALEKFDHVLEHAAVDGTTISRKLIVGALVGKNIANRLLDRADSAIEGSKRLSEIVSPNDSTGLRRNVVNSWWISACALYDSDRLEAAVGAWKQIPGFVRPDDSAGLRSSAARALAAAGDALAEIGQPEEALVTWKQITENVSPDDDVQFRYFAILALTKSAHTLFPKEYAPGSTLQEYEGSISAWQLLSDYVHQDDDADLRGGAVGHLSSAGVVLNVYEAFERAEAFGWKGIKLDPAHSESWRVLADSILGQADNARLSEAEEYARRAVELSLGDKLTLGTLSGVLARQGKWAEALECLEGALKSSGVRFQCPQIAGLMESLIVAVASGDGSRVKRIMKEAGLDELMEPLWHALRAELGEHLDPLPAEIMDAVNQIREEIAEKRE